MLRIFTDLLGQLKGGGLRAHLVRGALGGAGIQGGSAILALGLGIVLARNLGAEGYGVYAFSFAVMSLLMVAAEAGVPTLLMREVAASEASGRWGLLRGGIRRGTQFVAAVSILVSALGLLVLAFTADRLESASLWTLVVMLIALPIAALAKTATHALMGLHKVVLAQALELLLRPGLVLCLAGAVFFFSPRMREPYVAMAGQLVAAVTVVVVASLLVSRALPDKARNETMEFRSRQWLKSALPFTLIGAALVINNQIDLVMLGWFRSSAEVGIYRVAVQSAVLVVLSLQAVGAVVTPQISRLHTQNDTALLQRVMTRAAQAISVPAFVVFVALLAGGREFLYWVFGAEFAAAYLPLAILAFGRLALAVLGISGPLLTMTGFERIQSRAIWLAVIANAAMNFLLIPWLGAVGAAVSTAATTFGWIAFLGWFAHSRLGISVLPVAITPRFSIQDPGVD